MLSPTGLLLSRMSLNNAGSVVRAPSVVSEDIKIVMLGDSNVGKTCMCARFIQGRFLPDTTMTIGATYSTKIIRVGGNGSVAGARRAKVQIWDTAGQERFRSMARLYFREAKIGVVCFDITDKDTLGAAEYWIDELAVPVDICILDERHVIQVDGPTHFDQDGELKLADKFATALLEKAGWKVTRIRYDDVDKLQDDRELEEWLDEKLK